MLIPPRASTWEARSRKGFPKNFKKMESSCKIGSPLGISKANNLKNTLARSQSQSSQYLCKSISQQWARKIRAACSQLSRKRPRSTLKKDSKCFKSKKTIKITKTPIKLHRKDSLLGSQLKNLPSSSTTRPLSSMKDLRLKQTMPFANLPS